MVTYHSALDDLESEIVRLLPGKISIIAVFY